MKIIVSIVILSMLFLSGFGVESISSEKNEIIDTITFLKPVFQESDDFITVDLPKSTSYTFGSDKPYLPMVNRIYKFPFGTEIKDVKIVYSTAEERQLSKLIKPSPEPQILNTVDTARCLNTDIDTLYQNIEVFPEERFNYKVVAGLDNEEHVIYLIATFYPLQYVPKSDRLYFSDSANIHISFTPPDNPVSFPDEYDLLIITPSEFESALQPLVNHKNSLDPPTKTIVTCLKDIPSQGVDKQEDIKYYIKDAIENWGISYVILVGAGVEGEEKFPVRYAWVPSQPHEDYFPSDLYYADIYNGSMGFANWDVDGDGRYAEYKRDLPNIDVFPDVYLGKIPCNNIDELNTVVNKIIDYEEHNKMTNKILQIGGDSLSGNSIYEGEYANEKVLENLPGYNPRRLWASNGKLTKYNIATGFENNVDFVDISGHGNWASWSTHPPDDEETWIPSKTLISPYDGWLYVDYSLYRVNHPNKYPVVVFTACCNNKYTEDPNCIGWKTLSHNNGGSIATFAESGIGHGPGGPDFVNHGIGWMEVKIFEELYDTKVLGKAWANSISSYYYNFDTNFDLSDWKTMLEFSMFGDPSLAIEDGDDPRSRSVKNTLEYSFLKDMIVRFQNKFPILRFILDLK